ncbi:MAG: tRNA (adenosine(37)-N6)-dimethylallyltransferase MiaA [Candidatus Saccharimonadales bacterium]
MNSKLIAIVGETATGKSKLAMETAKQFNGEIINADSWQIYKHMDIGTAKPSKEDRAQMPHHLIDIANPDEDFNAAIYKNKAQLAIKDILNRGKLPIIVGGTGLYVDSVLFDYSFAPKGDLAARQELNNKTIDQLIDIATNKNISLLGIDTRNKRRLVRLIESNGFIPQKKSIRSNTLIIGTKTESRSKLRTNIEYRVETMFRHGLRREVDELAQHYNWDVEAMKGIGYREFKDYYEDNQSISETKRKIVKSTLDLAKRQRTWFKKNMDIKWVQSIDEGLELANDFINHKTT